jgi:arylsulfatase A-like enzyme
MCSSISSKASTISRRRFLKQQGLFAAGVGASALVGCATTHQTTEQQPSPQPAKAARRPNVIFILTDDQRWDNLSCEGHPFLKTPNMDRIASEGVRFTNSFVVNSLCSPSRAAFLSGLYSHQHGVLVNSDLRVTRFIEKVPTFPEMLHNSGYTTAYIGKLHMGRDNSPRKGYDHWMVLPGQGKYINPDYNLNGKKINIKGWADDITGDAAAKWFGEASEPFCAVVGIKSPHARQTPPERYKNLYDDVEIPRPDSYEEDYAATGKPNVVAEAGIRIDRFRGGPASKTDGKWQPWIKDFYRCITAADDNVGKILQALDKRGIAEDTLIIFAGDNGFFLGEHGLIDKRFAYEESLRIPLLVRYPRRIKSGQTPSEMALNIDVCPTILDYCGVKPVAPVAGKSLAPVMEGQPTDWRKDFLYEYDEPGFRLSKQGFPMPHVLAVRGDRYKYIEHLESNADKFELYDLKKDPKEMRNLIDDPAHAQVLSDMKRRLQRLQRETRWQPAIPILRWRVVGPFPSDQGKILTTAFAPEAGVDFNAVLKDGEGHPLRWREVAAKSEKYGESFIDLVDWANNVKNSCTYAAVEIDCTDPDCGACCFMGSKEGYTAFLNGKRIAGSSKPRPGIPRRSAFKLQLRKGRNLLMIKVARWAEESKLCASIQIIGKPHWDKPPVSLP